MYSGGTCAGAAEARAPAERPEAGGVLPGRLTAGGRRVENSRRHEERSDGRQWRKEYCAMDDAKETDEVEETEATLRYTDALLRMVSNVEDSRAEDLLKDLSSYVLGYKIRYERDGYDLADMERDEVREIVIYVVAGKLEDYAEDQYKEMEGLDQVIYDIGRNQINFDYAAEKLVDAHFNATIDRLMGINVDDDEQEEDESQEQDR